MSASYKVFDIDAEPYRFGRGHVLDDDCNALVVWANRKEAEGRGAARDRGHVGDLLVVFQRADPRVPIAEVHPRVEALTGGASKAGKPAAQVRADGALTPALALMHPVGPIISSLLATIRRP